jgi:hypothetical protein
MNRFAQSSGLQLHLLNLPRPACISNHENDRTRGTYASSIASITLLSNFFFPHTPSSSSFSPRLPANSNNRFPSATLALASPKSPRCPSKRPLTLASSLNHLSSASDVCGALIVSSFRRRTFARVSRFVCVCFTVSRREVRDSALDCNSLTFSYAAETLDRWAESSLCCSSSLQISKSIFQGGGTFSGGLRRHGGLILR